MQSVVTNIWFLKRSQVQSNLHERKCSNCSGRFELIFFFFYNFFILKFVFLFNKSSNGVEKEDKGFDIHIY